MTSLEKTGKTVEEALELALSELNVSREEVDYEILEVPSKALFGFIGGKLAKVRVTVKPQQDVAVRPVTVLNAIDPVAKAKELLTNIFKTMKLDVSIEKMTNEEGVTLNFRGDDLGVLIGKHGQTLDALQYLVNLSANRDCEERVRIILDVEDYRKRRAETLSNLAVRLADKVKRRGEKVVLEPMSPHERKIIHMALQNDNRISTYSEGEEPFRKVVISLKK